MEVRRESLTTAYSPPTIRRIILPSPTKMFPDQSPLKLNVDACVRQDYLASSLLFLTIYSSYNKNILFFL